jgi:SAM-dependent methyltransferase
MEIPSLFRKAQHNKFLQLQLSGKVLDLGGDKRSEYYDFIKGDYKITVLNINPKSSPDILHDLEKPLPIEDEKYDNVLLINVLEHIYEFRQLITETHRVLKGGGKVIATIPFLFPVHPSPRDFWRFTNETLLREFTAAGFKNIIIQPLGSGIFAARFQMIDRHTPMIIRIIFYPLRYVAALFDVLFISLARILGKKYNPNDYALGYFVQAKK